MARSKQIYRLLNVGEIVQDGDEDWWGGRWHPVPAIFIGEAVQADNDPPVRRRVQPMFPRTLNKVVVVVSGGALMSAYADTPVNIVLADQDDWEAEGLTQKQRDARFKRLVKDMEAVY